MLTAFCEWLAATSVSRTMQETSWIVPLVQSVHILAISILVATMAMFDLRVVGLLHRGQPLLVARDRFLPWAWRALIVLAASGALLILAEPVRQLMNLTFWTKMLLLALAVIMTAAMSRSLESRRDRAVEGRHPSIALQGLATASLIAWVAIVFCGRWIAYTQS